MIHTTVHVRPPLPRPRPHPAPASTPTKVEATSRKEKSSSGGTTNMNPMRPLALHDRRLWFLSLYGAENSGQRMHVGGGDGDVHSHQGHGHELGMATLNGCQDWFYNWASWSTHLSLGSHSRSYLGPNSPLARYFCTASLPSPFRCGPEIIRHTTISYNSSHIPRLHSSFHKKNT
ncbi:hypothetical protein J3A83DRAFT_189121 [Scleroderma citrinum]